MYFARFSLDQVSVPQVKQRDSKEFEIKGRQYITWSVDRLLVQSLSSL